MVKVKEQVEQTKQERENCRKMNQFNELKEQHLLGLFERDE